MCDIQQVIASNITKNNNTTDNTMENALTTAAQALNNMMKRNPALTPVPPTTVDKKKGRTKEREYMRNARQKQMHNLLQSLPRWSRRNGVGGKYLR